MAWSRNSTGVGRLAGADEDGRVVGVVGERRLARGVLLAGAVEALDGGAAVRAADPFVAGAELELGELRCGLTASRVANSVGTSTPLRGGR